MSDNDIRKILAERKKEERKTQRKAQLVETAQDIVAWGKMLMICFMLSVIGG